MRLCSLATIVLVAGRTGADLICLTWAVINTSLGNVCAFEPDLSRELDETADNDNTTAISIIETIAATLGDVGEFNVTHSPASLRYNYIDTATSQGLEIANANIRGRLEDFKSVDVNVTIQGANSSTTILEWTVWNDFWDCLLLGAVEASRNAAAPNTTDGNSTFQSLPRIPVDTAAKVLQTCSSRQSFELEPPLPLANKSDEANEPLSSIAYLLTPVSANLNVGDLPVSDGFDLVVAGTEETSRIVEWLPLEGNGVARHFSTEEEALVVKERLQQASNWPDYNCAVCKSPSALSIESRVAGKRGDELSTRGTSMSMCCFVPSTVKSPTYVNLPDSRVRKESELVPPPTFETHDWDSTRAEQLIKDINAKGSSVLLWSPELQDITTSEALFAGLRQMFAEGPGNRLWKKLRVKKYGKNRARAISDAWLNSYALNDRDLAMYAKFVSRLKIFACAVTLEAIEDMSRLPDIKATVEFFWTPPLSPSTTTTSTTDPARAVVQQLHLDTGYLAFSAADQPGLVIIGGDVTNPKASRIVPQPNTFQVMGGEALPFARRHVAAAWSTRRSMHAVFGPEIARYGRVSMVVTVHDKNTAVDPVPGA